ncbi:MAG: hypothetical protein WBK28_03345 [Minisyncoccia bacterium]
MNTFFSISYFVAVRPWTWWCYGAVLLLCFSIPSNATYILGTLLLLGGAIALGSLLLLTALVNMCAVAERETFGP